VNKLLIAVVQTNLPISNGYSCLNVFILRERKLVTKCLMFELSPFTKLDVSFDVITLDYNIGILERAELPNILILLEKFYQILQKMTFV